MNYKSISINKVIIKVMVRSGYSYTGAVIALNQIKADWKRNKSNKEYSLFKKLSWYKEGILIESAIKREESKDNRYYIPELIYYRHHPINNRYTKWIDDKLTLRYMLEPFKKYLPKYYFQLNKQDIKCLPDCPKELKNDHASIIKLLKQVNNLALKPFAESHGNGFVKLEYIDNKFYKNLKIIDEKRLCKFLESLENYIVTEYVISHHQFFELNPFSTSTLRVILINVDNQPKISSTYLKLGTKASGVIDNIVAGGIYSNVDITNGNIQKGALHGNAKHHKRVDVHPDTKKAIEGTVPYWDLLNKVLIEISTYLPQLSYLGYDIAITEEGFKIIEINSLQGFLNIESYFDCEVNQTYEQFFKNLLRK